MSMKLLLAFSFYYLSVHGNDFSLSSCSEAALNKWSSGHTIKWSGRAFAGSDGFSLAENPDHFFTERSYRITWPLSAQYVEDGSTHFWAFLASCLGATSAVSDEITNNKKHATYSHLQDFAQYVPGTAAFFEVTFYYPGQRTENKFVAYLLLNDQAQFQSDIFVLNPVDEHHLLAFHLPYRVAPVLYQSILATVNDSGANHVKLKKVYSTGVLTWTKGSFDITMEFSETGYMGGVWPSVQVSVKSRHGNGNLEPSTYEGQNFCVLYKALDAKVEGFAPNFHPKREKYSCTDVAVKDFSTSDQDKVLYTFYSAERII